MLAVGRISLKALRFLPMARCWVPVGFGHSGSDLGNEAAMELAGCIKYGGGR